MNKEPIILLGPKTFWWKVRVYLLSPFWFFSLIDTAKDTKSWSGFKHGLIKHKCEWDYDNPIQDQYSTHVECKHHGCNFVHVIKYS